MGLETPLSNIFDICPALTLNIFPPLSYKNAHCNVFVVGPVNGALIPCFKKNTAFYEGFLTFYVPFISWDILKSLFISVISKDEGACAQVA